MHAYKSTIPKVSIILTLLLAIVISGCSTSSPVGPETNEDPSSTVGFKDRTENIAGYANTEEPSHEKTPTNLKVWQPGFTHDNRLVRLSWSDNSFDERWFRIYRKTGSVNNWRLIGSTTTNQISFDDVQVKTGVTYTYRVQACSPRWYSGYSQPASISLGKAVNSYYRAAH